MLVRNDSAGFARHLEKTDSPESRNPAGYRVDPGLRRGDMAGVVTLARRLPISVAGRGPPYAGASSLAHSSTAQA